MAVGFPARASDTRPFAADPDAIGRAAVGVFQQLGWQYTGSTPDELQASIGISLWSWGERIRVSIGPGGMVTAHSAGAFPLQWIDWGKNRRNCVAFLEALERALPPGR